MSVCLFFSNSVEKDQGDKKVAVLSRQRLDVEMRCMRGKVRWAPGVANTTGYE